MPHHTTSKSIDIFGWWQAYYTPKSPACKSVHTDSETLQRCFSPDVLICSVGTEIFYNTKSPLVAPLLSTLASPATIAAAGAGAITATTATAITATPAGPIAITVVQPKAAEGEKNINQSLS